MASYSYKNVCFKIPEQYINEGFKERYGRDFEGDPNYDGDYWIAVDDWIIDLLLEAQAYNAMREERDALKAELALVKEERNKMDIAAGMYSVEAEDAQAERDNLLKVWDKQQEQIGQLKAELAQRHAYGINREAQMDLRAYEMDALKAEIERLSVLVRNSSQTSGEFHLENEQLTAELKKIEDGSLYRDVIQLRRENERYRAELERVKGDNKDAWDYANKMNEHRLTLSDMLDRANGENARITAKFEEMKHPPIGLVIPCVPESEHLALKAELERAKGERERLLEARMSDKSIWVYKEKGKLKPYFSNDGPPSSAYVQYLPASELQSLKLIAESPRAKLADLERLNIAVDTQGITFGKNCWIAHDEISPYGSTGSRQYLEWFTSLKLTKEAPRCPAHAALAEGEKE